MYWRTVVCYWKGILKCLMLNEDKIKYIKCYSRLLNDERLDKFDVILYGLVEYLSNNEKGFCTASNNTLASYLDCSRRTVIRSVNKLVEYDYLRRKNSQTLNSKNITHRELKPSDVDVTTLVTNMSKPSDVDVTTLVTNMSKPSDVDVTLKEIYKQNNIKELSNIKSSNKEHEKIENFDNEYNPLEDDFKPIEINNDLNKF